MSKCRYLDQNHPVTLLCRRTPDVLGSLLKPHVEEDLMHKLHAASRILQIHHAIGGTHFLKTDCESLKCLQGCAIDFSHVGKNIWASYQMTDVTKSISGCAGRALGDFIAMPRAVSQKTRQQSIARHLRVGPMCCFDP